MTTSATTGRDYRSALAFAIVSGLVGVLLAWATSTVTAEAAVRVLADGMGSAVLGLAALPRLHERLRAPWAPVAVLATVWFVTELLVAIFEAAQVVGVPVFALAPSDFATFITRISSGQIGIAILLATVAIAGYSALAVRRPQSCSVDLVVVFAAVALTLRPVTGHMSQQSFGSVLAAAHTLSAATWMGLLLGLALVVRSRGEWAVTLPRYSTVALPLVAVLTVTGLINGLVRVGELAALVDTGYGRILLAKTAVLVILLGTGWLARRSWVGPAAAHRVSAQVSLRRAVLEVVGMACAFGLAASLAVTG